MSADTYLDTGDRIVVRDDEHRLRYLTIVVNAQTLTVSVSTACHIYEGLQKALQAHGCLDERGRVT